MFPSWISSPNSSHRRIAPLDVDTVGKQQDEGAKGKPALAPIGETALTSSIPVNKSTTPSGSKSVLGSRQSVFGTKSPDGTPKPGSVVERSSSASRRSSSPAPQTHAQRQDSPFIYDGAFKTPEMPIFSPTPLLKSPDDVPRLDPQRWDLPIQYGRRLRLPDDVEGPNLTDPETFTKLANPSVSIIKKEGCLSLAMTEAISTIPIVDNEPILIPISKLGFNSLVSSKKTLEQFYPLLNTSQLGTLLLYLARIGDTESVGFLCKSQKIDINLTDDEGRSPMAYACMGGHLLCATHLYKNGANLNLFDRVGRSPLFHAAYFGHAEVVRKLIAWGADTSHTDFSGKNCLHYSVFSDNVKVTSNILSPRTSILSWSPFMINGRLLHATDRDGLTPLLWASYLGQYHHVKLIVSRTPATSSFSDIEGMNSLHWCVRNCHGKVAKILIEANKKLLEKKTLSGRSPIHLAAAEGNAILVEMFLKEQPRAVNVADRDRRTPLHFATTFGHLACINSLCRAGANMDHQDIKGATPLHYAVRGNFADAIHLLIKEGASPSIKDNDGRDPVLWAVLEGNLDLVKSLVNENASLLTVDNHGWDALHIAAVAGFYSACQFLLKSDIPIDNKDDREHTALMKAIAMGWTDIVRILLENGADANVVDSEGRSPLHWAVSRNLSEAVDLLIEFGVILNIVDDSGRQAIHDAAASGFDDIVQKIIAAGGLPDSPDNEGRTPLHFASMNGHHTVCAKLHRLGAPINSLDDHTPRCTPLDLAIENKQSKCSQFLVDHEGLTGDDIRKLAATSIQKAWKRHYAKNLVHRSAHYDTLRRTSTIRKQNAAIKIQAWFRGTLARSEVARKMRLAKATAFRNHEIEMTLRELDRAVREREAAEKERMNAEEERRQAELQRAEAYKLKKKMIEFKRQAAVECKQSVIERRDALNSVGIGRYHERLVRNAAAITIQKAWLTFRIKKIRISDPQDESVKTNRISTSKRRESMSSRRPSVFKATLPEISSLDGSIEGLSKEHRSSSQSISSDVKIQAAIKQLQRGFEPDSYFSIPTASSNTTTYLSSDFHQPSQSSLRLTPTYTPAGGVSPAIGGSSTQSLDPFSSKTPDTQQKTSEPSPRPCIKRRISFSAVESKVDAVRFSTASTPAGKQYYDTDGKPLRIALPSTKPTHGLGFPSLEHLSNRVPSLEQLSRGQLPRKAVTVNQKHGDGENSHDLMTNTGKRSTYSITHSYVSLPTPEMTMTPRGYDELEFHVMRRNSARRF